MAKEPTLGDLVEDSYYASHGVRTGSAYNEYMVTQKELADRNSATSFGGGRTCGGGGGGGGALADLFLAPGLFVSKRIMSVGEWIDEAVPTSGRRAVVAIATLICAAVGYGLADPHEVMMLGDAAVGVKYLLLAAGAAIGLCVLPLLRLVWITFAASVAMAVSVAFWGLVVLVGIELFQAFA